MRALQEPMQPPPRVYAAVHAPVFFKAAFLAHRRAPRYIPARLAGGVVVAQRFLDPLV